MSKFSLLTQLGLIVIAFTIGSLYIKPMVEKIGLVEDKTALYREESKKVSEVNQLLTQKLSIVDSVTPADKDNLLRYLSDTIDDIAVMKDVVAMFNQVSVDVDDIVYKKTDSSKNVEDPNAIKGVMSHSFSLSASMQYDQLMTVLRSIEMNNYLLQITELKISPDEVGQITVNMVLNAYTKVPRESIVSDVTQ